MKNILEKEFYQLSISNRRVLDFLQESALDGMSYIDIENPSNRWMNEQFWKLLGYSKEEYQNEQINPLDLIYAEDQQVALNHIKLHCHEDMSTMDHIIRYKHKSGKTMWIRSRCMTIHDDQGKSSRVLSAHINITELKRKEQFLSQCNTAAKIGYWEVDLVNDVITWSKMTKEIHGVPDDYTPNLTSAISFFEKDKSEDLITKLVNEAIYSHKSYEAELEIITLSGQRKWVKTIGIPEISQNKCIGIYGTFQDIDEQKKNQQLLQENVSKFRGIFDSTFSFIGFLTPEGVLLEANHTAMNMAGLKPEDVIGKNFWDCYWWQISEETKIQLRKNIQIAASGQEIAYEVPVWIKDKQPVTILFSLRPVFDQNGQVIFIIPEGRPIQEIVDARNRYKSVIEGTNVGTWEWNVQTGETIFNERWAEIVGYTLEELAPISIETWLKLAHPDDLKISEKKLQACFDKTAEYYDCECRMRHKDGHWVWVQDRGKVFIWTNDGKPLLMFGTHQDITESKKTTQLLGTFIQQAPSAIAMFDLELRYITASEKWLLQNDLESQEIYGKRYFDLTKEVRKSWNDHFQSCLNGQTHSADEEKFIKSDGSVYWLKWKMKPWKNDQGNIGGILMYTEDITDKKIAEEQFLISQKAFKANFDNAAIGMAILNEKGQWIEVNKRLCDIVGYSSDELKALTFQAITHPEDLDVDLGLFQELKDGKRTHYQLEKRYIHKDGHIINIILAGAVVRDLSGQILYFVSQIVDISELKQAEQQVKTLLNVTQDQNARLKNFAHIVSHNLKSHAGGISMLLDLLQGDKPDLFEEEVFKLFRGASENLSETIKHLTEVVEVNLNAQEKHENILLKPVIQKNIDSIATIAKNAQVNINYQSPESLSVSAIPAYLDSIVLNFLTNGIKYRDPQKAQCSLKITAQEVGENVLITFEDNGLGIDLNRHGEKLFGMYKTFHKNTDAKGIGLFITKNQVESMGGKIEVSSQVGVGTTFSVYLKKSP
ncbi:PAS domain S-box protein [Penaeicola halotolerans]|uniref:PAS domain S-box protein n=1 Tax=Penaeicola halotolerans TaxID=2793196 RepID=UPI001CF9271A|nr:PAS domain S-box protein [Penaeicola halotolerans]